MPPPLGGSSGGLPSCLGYLPQQGVLLPRVYGTITSVLLGLSAWQATLSWAAYGLACHRLPPWLRVTCAMVIDAAWPASDQRPWGNAPAAGLVGQLGRPCVCQPRGVLCCYLSLRHPRCARLCGVLGPLALVHQCACPVCSVCSLLGHLAPVPVCTPGVLCCLCGVLGVLPPAQQCFFLMFLTASTCSRADISQRKTS